MQRDLNIKEAELKHLTLQLELVTSQNAAHVNELQEEITNLKVRSTLFPSKLRCFFSVLIKIPFQKLFIFKKKLFPPLNCNLCLQDKVCALSVLNEAREEAIVMDAPEEEALPSALLEEKNQEIDHLTNEIQRLEQELENTRDAKVGLQLSYFFILSC